MKLLKIGLAALGFALLGMAIADETSIPPATQSQLTGLIATMYPQLDGLYKDIHSHPELAFEEVRTAGLLAAEMRKAGFEVTEKIGKTGLVAIYKNGPGPMIMVRTELDALPMAEKTGLPYASTAKTQYSGHETGVMHSCGHDIHMASWLGTARVLIAMKDQWHGTLMFVAQPAEEIGKGARAMMADGLFKRFGKPDLAFALHTFPFAYGTVQFAPGATSSNMDTLEITFKGRGGHGSTPNRTIDPITIAAHFITDVQAVISRERDPFEFGVISIGAIEAGTASNIIPDQAVLRGTVRSFKPEVREKMIAGIHRTASAVAAMAGAPEPEVKLDLTGLAVINDEGLLLNTEKALKSVIGDAKVSRRQPMAASEDFSEFSNAGVPSMYFFIGVYDPQRVAESMKPDGPSLPFNHSPLFAPVPEPSIKTGITAMSVAVLNAFKYTVQK